VNEIDESLTNIDSVPDPTDSAKIAAFLAEGKFFQGGNAQMLHKLLQITAGER
jgi:hypothetical protein